MEREVTGWGESEQRDRDLVPGEERGLRVAVGMGGGGVPAENFSEWVKWFKM